jgi:hypothetical protein
MKKKIFVGCVRRTTIYHLERQSKCVLTHQIAGALLTQTPKSLRIRNTPYLILI